MPFLESTDYDSIRRAISASLTDVTLPDPVIEDPLVLGKAEDYIERRVGSAYEDLDEPGRAHSKRAAMYYAAFLLAPAIPGQLAAAQNHRGAGGGVVVPNWRTIADELFNRAEAELDLVSAEDTDEQPGIAVTSGSAATQAGW